MSIATMCYRDVIHCFPQKKIPVSTSGPTFISFLLGKVGLTGVDTLSDIDRDQLDNAFLFQWPPQCVKMMLT